LKEKKKERKKRKKTTESEREREREREREMEKRMDEKADWTVTGADFTELRGPKAGAVGVPFRFCEMEQIRRRYLQTDTIFVNKR